MEGAEDGDASGVVCAGGDEHSGSRGVEKICVGGGEAMGGEEDVYVSGGGAGALAGVIATTGEYLGVLRGRGGRGIVEAVEKVEEGEIGL